ncbi:hypothetical protein LOZ80_34620 [Paenibacillus sp. HWE-109]|uniref:hypothetical protein n=1 Tax=Paenibacillus sp. HWE-109 TaxID=1306526 RepID=UPI001EDFAB98|nr:hypothetical protein [Paenibacillus sp. HWE-109]UKS26593.1 hypothetical protein LOZ80_34620 [Paenibacillus sp. HWE-109]
MGKMTEIHYLLPIDCIYLSDELFKIKSLMNIHFDDDFLMSKYDSYGRGRGDVIVFKAEIGNPECILFDLYNSFTDQNNMVLFGVRCFEGSDIEKVMLELLNKSEPTSKFIINEENYLSGIADASNYPKIIKYSDNVYSQCVELYVNNRKINESI